MNSIWMLYNRSRKFAVQLALICLFFAACAPIQSSTPSSFTPERSTPIPTETAIISSSPTPTNTIISKVDNTPTTAAPKPIRLSPINGGNVGQLQVLFTHHITWDALSYGVAAISPNRKWVALGAKYNSELYLLPLSWVAENSIAPEVDTDKTKSYKMRIESLAFSPDSNYLAVANGDSSVIVFDLNHPDKTEVLNVPDWPTAVTFIRDNKTLAVGTMRGLEGSVKIFDLETNAIKQELSKNTSSGGICSIGVSPNEEILAIGYCTYVFDISTWDIDQNYAHIARLTGVSEIGYCAHFCTDNRNIIAFDPITGDIASGTNYGSIPLQDVHSGKLRTIIYTGYHVGEIGYDASPINALAFTPSGDMLIIAASPELEIRDKKTGDLLWLHQELNYSIDAMAMSADARLIITVNSNGDIGFWGIQEK